MRNHADELGLGPLALPQAPVLVLELSPARLEPFGHPVEGDRQLRNLADTVRLEPCGQVAAGELSGAFCDVANGARDRPCEVEPEADDQQR